MKNKISYSVFVCGNCGKKIKAKNQKEFNKIHYEKHELDFKVLKKKENGYNLIEDPEKRKYDLIELQIGNNNNRKIVIDFKDNNLTIFSRNNLVTFHNMKDYYSKYKVRFNKK